MNDIISVLQSMWGIMRILLPILAVILLIVIIKPYVVKEDTVVLYTGGLGKGKSLLASQKAIQRYRRQRLKYRVYNLFHKKKREMPLLVSNIPLSDGKRIISVNLSADVMKGKARIPQGTVTYIDELSLFCNQWQNEKNNPSIKDMEDFVTLYRHYTHGGSLILNTQSVHKVNYNIRYCLDVAYHCEKFHHIFRIAWIDVRQIDITEDVVNTNAGFERENTKRVFIILPSRKNPTYDSYCYSDLYAPSSELEREVPKSLKATDKVRL